MQNSVEEKLPPKDSPHPDFVEHYMQKYEHFRLPKSVLMEILARKQELRETASDNDAMISLKLRFMALHFEHGDQLFNLPLEKYLADAQEKWEEAQKDFPETGYQDSLIYWAKMLEGPKVPLYCCPGCGESSKSPNCDECETYDNDHCGDARGKDIHPSLVRAAPDMLEALKMLVESSRREDVGPRFAYDNAVAVIHKVEEPELLQEKVN